MKSITFAVIISLLALSVPPLIGLAQPTRAAAKGEARPAGEKPAEIRAAMRQRWKDFTPTPDQVAEAVEFYSQNAPNLANAYRQEKEKLKDRKAARNWPDKWLAGNYMDLKAVGKADPELFKMKLDELKLEDDITGKLVKPREPGNSAKREIKPLVEQLLELRKKETAHRIERLHALIDNEEQQLDEMNKNASKWVDERVVEEVRRGRAIFPAELRNDASGPTTAEN